MANRCPPLPKVRPTHLPPISKCDARYEVSPRFNFFVFPSPPIAGAVNNAFEHVRTHAPLQDQKSIETFRTIRVIDAGFNFRALQDTPICYYDKGITVVFYPANV